MPCLIRLHIRQHSSAKRGRKAYKYLENIYGNPHSSNPASHLSEKFVHEARNKVLQFFNVKDYYYVFAANASAALKIVRECYPFSSQSHLLLRAERVDDEIAREITRE